MTESRSWSWRHAILKSGLPATTRHVLLTISCFMNDVGGGCYPTQEQLAEASGLSDRAVRAHIETAVAAGWLRRKEHGFKGQKWRNHEYEAAWPDIPDDDAPEPDVVEGAERGSGPSQGEVAERHSPPLGQGAERGSGKVRNDVPTTSPYTTPEGRKDTPSGALARRGGKDFSEGGAAEAPDAEVYRFAKTFLGKNAGGLVTKLKRQHGGDLRAVMDTLKLAAGKAEPREWIGAVLRGDRDAEWERREAEIYASLR